MVPNFFLLKFIKTIGNMEEGQNIFEFLQGNKKLLQEYVEVRVDIFKLELIKTSSHIGGLLTWLIILTFLLFLISIFAGITIGFWFAGILNSNAAGFAVTTGLIILLAILLALFRKQLFINPVISILIKQINDEEKQF
jgi:hypothetical protein